MTRLAVLVVAVMTVMAGLAFAQAKPDFSGTWVLDEAKSDPMGGPGGGRGPAGPMTITQTADEFVTETTRGEMVMKQTVKLDGTETVNQMGPMQAKTKAQWDGRKLVVTMSGEGPNGPMERKSTYSLSEDGKVLTVTMTSPRGDMKRVYNKK